MYRHRFLTVNSSHDTISTPGDTINSTPYEVHLLLPVRSLVEFRIKVQQRPGPEHAVACQLQFVHGMYVQHVKSVMGIPIQTDSGSGSDSDSHSDSKSVFYHGCTKGRGC